MRRHLVLDIGRLVPLVRLDLGARIIAKLRVIFGDPIVHVSGLVLGLSLLPIRHRQLTLRIQNLLVRVHIDALRHALHVCVLVSCSRRVPVG